MENSIDRRTLIAVLLINSLFFIAILHRIYAALYFTAINEDSGGYWLPMAENMANGWQLYRDIRPSHTSSFLYLLSGFREIFENATYQSYLVFFFGIILAAGLLLYGIARLKGASKGIAFLLCQYLILSVLRAGGQQLTSEVVGMFLFLATSLVLATGSRRVLILLLAGIFCGAAATVKQYAVSVIAALLAAIFFTPEVSIKSRIGRCAAASVGSLLPIALYFGQLYSAAGSFTALSQDVFGTWYKWEWSSFPVHIQNLIFFQPHLLLLPFFIPRVRDLKDCYVVFAWLAFFGSISSGFVRQYMHYLIYTFPFSVQILLLYLTREDLPYHRVAKSFVRSAYLATVALAIPISSIADSTNIVRRNERGVQLEVKQEINRVVPRGSKALVMGHPALYYLADLRPGDNQLVGYFFLSITKPENLMRVIETVPYIIIEQRFSGYYEVGLRQLGLSQAEFEEKLRGLKTRVELTRNGVEIWQNK